LQLIEVNVLHLAYLPFLASEDGSDIEVGMKDIPKIYNQSP
jgi:hypothetical protein